MKNFNRSSSNGHHDSKLRELAQHAHSRGSHTYTHTLKSTQLQPHCAKRQLSYYRFDVIVVTIRVLNKRNCVFDFGDFSGVKMANVCYLLDFLVTVNCQVT